MDGSYNLKHIEVPSNARRKRYSSPQSGRSELPFRRRAAHAAALIHQLRDATTRALRDIRDERDSDLMEGEEGFYLCFISPKNAYKPEAFEDLRKGIVVTAVTDYDDLRYRVTVFVPERCRRFFLEKLTEYRDKETATGNPKNNDRIARIDSIDYFGLRSVFTDPDSIFPEQGRRVWWEVWLRSDRAGNFLAIARELGLELREDRLEFPEREVLLVRATPEQMEVARINSDAIAELRVGRDTPATIIRLEPERQFEATDALRRRVVAPPRGAPAVCVLDTGINDAHPLISVATSSAEVETYSSAWGTDDTENHGTPMSGLALYGDLSRLIGQSTPIRLRNRLESVKIVPRNLNAAPRPHLYGAVTRDSVSIIESVVPDRKRIFFSAITNGYPNNVGLPTQWSAEIDRLASEPSQRRLFLISAGNYDDGDQIPTADYPIGHDTASIFDPAQSWNALTVGAFTERTVITDPQYAGYVPLAPHGALSPYSRTSVGWSRPWPIKPDIVLEGGNFAFAPGDETATAIDDMLMLSTGAEFRTQPVVSFAATSGATALAAHLAGEIQADYPDYWPETLRALMVHSAEWTPHMIRALQGPEAERVAAMRRYGYGVPDLARAKRSAQSDVAMVVQDFIQPFFRDHDSQIKNNEILYYRLPWPTQQLLDLGATEIVVKATLSYFIEPNPARRGWLSRYSYASHGLRFAMRRPGERIRDFEQRLNGAQRDEDFEAVDGADGWFLRRARNRGSIHSDTWIGTAAEFADTNYFAVYPVMGWWRQLRGAQRFDASSRFSLIVSIRSAESSVDLYTPIEAAIEASVEVET